MKATSHNDGRDTPDLVSFILDSPEKVTLTFEADYSTVACYIANQAFRTKSRVTWNPEWDLL
jgi:hypothetical protein